MRTGNKIFFFLIIVFLWSCDSLVEVDERPINRCPSIPSVSTIDGKFKVDSHVINTGQNLDALILDLEKTVLSEKKKVADIPTFIKMFLDSISYEKTFSIANHDENWQVGCTSVEIISHSKRYNKKTKDTVTIVKVGEGNLPTKQLVYFGLGKDIALLSYFTGGIGKSQHVNIIKFNGDKIVDFWFDYGIPFGSTKNEIIKFIRRHPNKNSST